MHSRRSLLRRLQEGSPSIDTLREDRAIAAARCILATVSLIAIYLDPTEPTRFVTLAYSLLAAYVVFSMAVLFLSRKSTGFSQRLRIILHVTDMIWVSVVTFFTTGPNSPFFLFSLFVLLAAAYRWGFRETLLTASVFAAVLIGQAVMLSYGPFAESILAESSLQLNRVIIRATHLLMMGVLLGFLAEEEKLHRAETALFARMLSIVQASRGMRRALQSILAEIMQLLGSPRVWIPIREVRTGQRYLWTAHLRDETATLDLRLSEAEFPEELISAPLPAYGLTVLSDLKAQGFTAMGDTVGQVEVSSNAPYLPKVSFQTLLIVPVEIAQEWNGRLLLFDSQYGGSSLAERRLLLQMMRELLPAMHNLFLVRRLRWRAGVIERSRLARELHDGVIQSLVALEMEIEAYRRQLTGAPSSFLQRLGEIQERIHQEILNLREAMEQVRPIDTGPREIVEQMSYFVDRFQRDCGISVTFVCPFEELVLPPQVARECLRILQEALVNIRKHSRARNAVVRLSLEDHSLKLVIDDDGKGFDFAGRLSLDQLDAQRRGPTIIKERVRALSGNMIIDSIPGSGTRLEIALPR